MNGDFEERCGYVVREFMYPIELLEELTNSTIIEEEQSVIRRRAISYTNKNMVEIISNFYTAKEDICDPSASWIYTDPETTSY